MDRLRTTEYRGKVTVTCLRNRMEIMGAASFIKRQIIHIRQGGYGVLLRKIKIALLISPRVFYSMPLLILGIPAVVVIRAIKPWLLVRWRDMKTGNFGHLALNTEMYLCERDAGINVPRQRYVDISFVQRRICNKELVRMWRRIHHVWPFWVLPPVRLANWLIPGGAVHEIGNNALEDRDVHHLQDRFSPHLHFTADEEARGEAGLRKMGIPAGTPFICLTVRDSAYYFRITRSLNPKTDFRDCDVRNFVLAAEELADRGYYVIRMGAKVNRAIESSHPRIIDYASNGMRSEFLDIYLGAKCEFCISTSTGFNAVPMMFHRPVVFVNTLPLGYLATFGAQYLHITRHHFSVRKGRELTLREIISCGAGLCDYTSDYESKGIQVIENTPEEIRDVVIEMSERIRGTWHAHEDDELLQRRFWEIFPTDAKTADGRPVNGEIRARFGAAFLRNNRGWLED